MTLREAAPADIPEIRELFTQTVLTVNSKDYTAEETADWASCGESMKHWQDLLENLYFILSTDGSGHVTGFASIRRDGYLHSLFVHKSHQREGIGTSLLAAMEASAAKNGVKVVTSEVSITARPFFEHHGYSVVAEQRTQANKIWMTNYKMKKNIAP